MRNKKNAIIQLRYDLEQCLQAADMLEARLTAIRIAEALEEVEEIAARQEKLCAHFDYTYYASYDPLI